MKVEKRNKDQKNKTKTGKKKNCKKRKKKLKINGEIFLYIIFKFDFQSGQYPAAHRFDEHV